VIKVGQVAVRLAKLLVRSHWGSPCGPAGKLVVFEISKSV